jgi:RNA polymerase sigma-70 factor (ECF subfamily)
VASQATTPATELSDDDILAAFERGDPARGRQLYDHLIGAVEASLYRVLGRREPEHDDLVQTVFEQILLTLHKRRFAHACSLRSWAAAISCNVALNTLRSRTSARKVFDREQELGERPERHTASDPERALCARSELERLRRLLARITPQKATTLILHDGLGYELAEISVLTGATLAAAQSRLVRARRELKGLLESDEQAARRTYQHE